MTQVKFDVETLKIRNNSIYSHGWLFSSKDRIKRLYYKINKENSNNSFYKINLEFNLERKDIGNSFPKIHNAKKSGFSIYAGLPKELMVKRIQLICEFETHELFSYYIPWDESNNLLLNRKISFLRKIKKIFIKLNYLIKKILDREFYSIFEKLRSIFSMITKKNITILKLKKILINNKVTFIIDHEIGGGANLYRNKLIKKILKNEKNIFLLTFNIQNLSYKIRFINKKTNFDIYINQLEDCIKVLKNIEIEKIIINNIVSFPNPEKIPEFLLNIKKISNAKIKMLIHDYVSICPSFNLINNEGIFCKIPSKKTCKKCSEKNERGIFSFFVSRDITLWRSNWSKLIKSSEEIIVFSKSSYEMINKCYGKINKKIKIEPHEINHMPNKIPKIKENVDFKIGILGNINFNKGSKIVKSLIEEIKNKNLNIEIVLFGRIIEDIQNDDPIRIIGTYIHKDLPKLIEKNKVNTFLFPSICPETFSYVVEEIIYMDLRIACFDLGAPADRISKYKKGRILSSDNPSLIIKDLLKLSRKRFN